MKRISLADAIDRAGSTEAEKIRNAWSKTDRSNGKKYALVWPEAAANAKLQWLMAGGAK